MVANPPRAPLDEIVEKKEREHGKDHARMDTMGSSADSRTASENEVAPT